MAVTILKSGNPAKKEPTKPPPDMPLVGRCHECLAEWECVGADVRRASISVNELKWWMSCPECGYSTCGVYTRDSVMGKIITGERDREDAKRSWLAVVGMLVIVVLCVAVAFAVK